VDVSGAEKVGSVRWTGDNDAEMAAFAAASRFGFVVGSNVHRYRWWHRAFNRLVDHLPARWYVTLEWTPKDDLSVIEVYPTDSSTWTTARPGDWVRDDGTVDRPGDRSRKSIAEEFGQ
jgi:hypothetical protein